MTSKIVDVVPLMDPLLRAVGTEHSVAFPVLGIRVRFETNGRQVLDLVEESKGNWISSEVDGTADELTVRIIVRDGHEDAKEHADVRHISTDDGRLIIQSSGSVGVVDPIRREALAYVTSELVADRANFQSTVLEAMTFALLASQDRHPVHAAAIGGSGRALLLAGESGAGKSTLAFLAHTNGMPVLSEDRVWVALQPSLRVWSTASVVHLRREALAHFPDVRTRGARIAQGAGKIAVTVMGTDVGRTLPATRAVVCMLAWGREASLSRADAPTLIAELQRQTAPGFDRFPDRHERVLEAITAGGGWRLTLSSTPNDALPHLKRMLEES